MRDYTTETGSNRMTALDVGANTYGYTYDAGGNLIQENTERHFEWDFAGRMRAFRNQVASSQATVFAHYSYDAGGERVQKVVTKGSKTTRTVYVGGVFEHQQVIENDAVSVENQTLHLMDDTGRVATHRAGGELDGAQRPAARFHLGDHLQSSTVVLRQVQDVNGALFVNREEYRPYGETAFGSFEYKRYRFTGKEKDEESGLHYHSARYYAPWMARWTAPDPLGMVDGPNLYEYVSGNPVRLVDPGGTEKHKSDSQSDSGLWAGAVSWSRDALAEVNKLAESAGEKYHDASGKLLDKVGVKTGPARDAADKLRAVQSASLETGLKVGGLLLCTGPAMIVSADRAGTNIGEGAARTYVGNTSEEKALGVAQASAGVAEGALLVLQALGMAEGMAAESIVDDAGQDLVDVLFSKSEGERFSAQKLTKVKDALSKLGVEFGESADDLRYLDSMGAEAAYVMGEPGTPGTIILGDNPSRAAVIEEIIHYAQHRSTGFAAATQEQAVKFELEAQQKLLRIGEAQGWTHQEMERISQALKTWTKMAKKLGVK